MVEHSRRKLADLRNRSEVNVLAVKSKEVNADLNTGHFDGKLLVKISRGLHLRELFRGSTQSNILGWHKRQRGRGRRRIRWWEERTQLLITCQGIEYEDIYFFFFLPFFVGCFFVLCSCSVQKGGHTLTIADPGPHFYLKRTPVFSPYPTYFIRG